MGSLLGFRLPQFSEEAAWLPTWLQQQNAESLDEFINRGETSFEQRIQEVKILGHTIDKGENAVSSSCEGYRNCHLMLSGDESSPLSSFPSTKDVVHVHLHLTSDGNSDSMSCPLVDPSQTQGAASYPVELKQARETSVLVEGTTNQSIIGKDDSLISCSLDTRPDDVADLMRHEENGKCSEDELNDVVELSIAASEAVVIHGMMTDSILKSLPVSTSLEVAFQVKKARLDVCKEKFDTAVICEVNDLLDMDDSTMADAYEDVGLCIGDLGLHNHYDNLSQVNHAGIGRYGEELECETTGRSLHFGKEKLKEVKDPERQLREDMVSFVSDDNVQKKLSKEPSLCSGSIMDCQNDTVASSSVPETVQASLPFEMDKNVGDCGIGEQNFFHEPVKFYLAGNSEVAEKHDKVLEDLVPGRYQSRWFGGWASKKEVKSSLVACNKVKFIPQPLIGETSFFTESADVVPDENSVAHNQDGGTLTSYSSFTSVGLRDKKNAEALLSQDIVGCSASPSASCDPLCSIVPCSISPENIISTSAVNHEGSVPTRGYSTGTTEYTTDNLLEMKTSQNKLVHEEESNIFVSEIERSQPAVYRKLTSLRTYSVLQPNPRTNLVKESCHDKPLPLDGNPENSTIKNFVSHFPNEENCNTTAKNVAKSRILKKREILPHILRGRSRGRSLAFSRLRSIGLEAKTLIQDAAVDVRPSKDPEKLRSNCHSEYNVQVPGRKRVRFLEAETNYDPEMTLQKQQRSLRICSLGRAAKALGSHSGPQGCKSCQINYFKKDEKTRIFQNLDFLLTGFSHRKEKELEDLIRDRGGIVLSDIPFPPKSGGNSISKFNHHKLPVVLCPKRLQTIKFLYGCAVNAFVLKTGWLTDSIVACSLLPPERYAISPKSSGGRYSRIGEPMHYKDHQPIFGGTAIMLHGKSRFCIDMAKIIRHGGGQVCKTLNCLVNSLDSGRVSFAAIVADNEARTSRHLKHCALERKIPMLSSSWFIKSLQRGKLLPCKESSTSPPIKAPLFAASVELSPEF